MQVLLNKIKYFILKYWKTIIYITIIGFTLYFLIYIFTPKPQIPTDLKLKIDSLTKVNKILEHKNDSLNIILININNKIDNLEYKLKNQKEKITIIREYYSKPIDVSKYTLTQVDSFFKQRYKY